MKIERVLKVSTKGWLSRALGPFLLLPLSQEERFCFLSFGRICSWGYYIVVACGENIYPNFPEEILILACSVSFN